jgi:hypothetical protein
VKGYVSRLLDKLGCENRTQAARIAYEAGLGRAQPAPWRLAHFGVVAAHRPRCLIRRFRWSLIS